MRNRDSILGILASGISTRTHGSLKPLHQGATAFQEEFRGPVSGSAASKEELKVLFHGIGICCRGYKWMGDD
jgi:hypothetical protein